MTKPFYTVILLTLTLVLPGTRGSAQDFSQVVIEAVPAGEGIYMLTGAGGNVGLCVGQSGALLVDDQFAPLTEKLLAKVGELTDQPVQFVVNTHWHGDHTGGNENMGKAGAVLVAHDNVRERMSADQFLEAFGQTRPAAAAAALPQVTFSENLTFHWEGQTVAIHHMPHAHTDSDAVVHFMDANVVHLGDIYFSDFYPFIDTSTGGSVRGVIAALETCLEMTDADTKFIPGHGSLADRSRLQGYLAMLKDVSGKIEAAVGDGKSLEEVQAQKPTASYDEVWGDGFLNPDKFVEILYKDLSR